MAFPWRESEPEDVLSSINVECHEWTCMSEAGLYDSALSISGLLRKDGTGAIALSELRISHLYF